MMRFRQCPGLGEANVHVSIANWTKGDIPIATPRLHYFAGINEEDEYVFRTVEMAMINSALSEKTDVSDAEILQINRDPKRVFQGQITGNSDFVFEPDEALDFIKRDSNSSQVLFPFMIGRDLVSQPNAQPSRYVLDLSEYDIMEAQDFKGAYRHIQQNILPVRQAKAEQEQERNKKARQSNPKARLNHHHRNFLNQWWKLSYGREDMLNTIKNTTRYIVCSEVTKRSIFDFTSPLIRPDHTLIVFTYEDDYTFGILQSNAHWQWFTEKGSTLTERFRYTPHSVFDTFPFRNSHHMSRLKRWQMPGAPYMNFVVSAWQIVRL